ncbi:hypothetical protein BDR06DRAFT_1062639 [Suillus hirtellus]|nr:hypothetical protein BDR06DRAFT_1062639 [Suillus hirtellus]
MSPKETGAMIGAQKVVIVFDLEIIISQLLYIIICVDLVLDYVKLGKLNASFYCEVMGLSEASLPKEKALLTAERIRLCVGWLECAAMACRVSTAIQYSRPSSKPTKASDDLNLFEATPVKYFAKQTWDLTEFINAPTMVACALMRMGEIQLYQRQLDAGKDCLVKAVELLQDLPGVDAADMSELNGDWNCLNKQTQDTRDLYEGMLASFDGR